MVTEFDCKKCDGTGEIECAHCGNYLDCDACEGNGVDHDLVDIVAFDAAESALRIRLSLYSVDLEENDIVVGRQCGPEKLYYRDFLFGDKQR